MTGRRFSVEWLDEITAPAEKWRRRCGSYPGGYPIEGVLVTARSLRVVLAVSTNISVDAKRVITWTNGLGRQFSAEPVYDEAPVVPE